jgi:hypothetical protein
MNHPHFLFADTENEDRRCPHGKLLPMPKTREQRAAERQQFNRRFFLACLSIWCCGMGLLVLWLMHRGGR